MGGPHRFCELILSLQVGKEVYHGFWASHQTVGNHMLQKLQACIAATAMLMKQGQLPVMLAVHWQNTLTRITFLAFVGKNFHGLQDTPRGFFSP